MDDKEKHGLCTMLASIQYLRNEANGLGYTGLAKNLGRLVSDLGVAQGVANMSWIDRDSFVSFFNAYLSLNATGRQTLLRMIEKDEDQQSSQRDGNNMLSQERIAR